MDAILYDSLSLRGEEEVQNWDLNKILKNTYSQT